MDDDGFDNWLAEADAIFFRQQAIEGGRCAECGKGLRYPDSTLCLDCALK